MDEAAPAPGWVPAPPTGGPSPARGTLQREAWVDVSAAALLFLLKPPPDSIWVIDVHRDDVFNEDLKSQWLILCKKKKVTEPSFLKPYLETQLEK